MNYTFAIKSLKINLSSVKSPSLYAYSNVKRRCPVCLEILEVEMCCSVSSIESEFISLTESVKQLTWYSRILNELNLCYKIKSINTVLKNMPFF